MKCDVKTDRPKNQSRFNCNFHLVCLFKLAIAQLSVRPSRCRCGTDWTRTLLLILSLILFFSSDRESEDKEQKRTVSKQQAGKLFGVFLFLLLYVALLERVGFIAVSTLFLFTCTRFLGYRRNIVNGIVSIVVPSVLYTLFRYGLGIHLPQGIAPF